MESNCLPMLTHSLDATPLIVTELLSEIFCGVLCGVRGRQEIAGKLSQSPKLQR